MRKLVLIDGNALLHRAYHAYPPLTTPKGELVGAVYGFSVLLLSVLEKLSPTHVAVAWDVKGPTFRKIAFDEYKANRGPMDEDLVSQIERTKEVVEVLNIPQFGIEGFEADDIIGTLSWTATDEKNEADTQAVIVTGDRDALQLIKDKRVVVYLPIHNRYSQSEVFDEGRVIEVYGLRPDQMIDLKALMGDASDNIPGVKGVGKVTATKLIQDFGTLKNLYKKLDDERIKPRTRIMLESGRDIAWKSRELAEIDRHVPLDFDWESCLLTNYDKDKAVKLFEELSFKSLIGKLPSDEWEKTAEEVFL
ncbi:MAG: polymerase protein [Candidatus Collierbacteria bacterium GW2011_GWA1_44_12]|uniref:Polymerase protein n=1 Tax=Candidatus Collierbacteria bacterium GW2011_GWA1_44_12 TaxID=1618376 RepID=A0A0G1GLD5_9BACT|nr:MAG: polymerase protein [Candidatus Collierbacteria bacterium GW2011_GWA1_44_12]